MQTDKFWLSIRYSRSAIIILTFLLLECFINMFPWCKSLCSNWYKLSATASDAITCRIDKILLQVSSIENMIPSNLLFSHVRYSIYRFTHSHIIQPLKTSYVAQSRQLAHWHILRENYNTGKFELTGLNFNQIIFQGPPKLLLKLRTLRSISNKSIVERGYESVPCGQIRSVG